MDRASVAVIGGGFSGLLAALHLLSRHDGPRVQLIEKGVGFGPGLAYGACAPEHLLNVRAGNMSAFPARPTHFVDWVRERGHAQVDGAAFVTRATYGDYLLQLLRAAATTPGAAGRLDLVSDQAVGLKRRGAGFETTLAMGRTIATDAIVLALGNLAPAAPALQEGALSGPAYIADPWAPGVLGRIAPHDSVMLIGSGLTMADVALSLSSAGHTGHLFALSRRGLAPRRHAGIPTGTVDAPPPAGRLSLTLRAFRKAARAANDWREPFDALRPLTPLLWRRLDPAERARFLRHLKPYWDVHRHRLAPGAADRLGALRSEGQLELEAGRLVAVEPRGAGLSVTWRPRGAAVIHERTTDWVVNCTGPGTDVNRAADPLIRGLLEQGLARPDGLGLGFDVDQDGQVRGADGAADARLTALGPLTRGAFWEATAVPDIRVQAAALAAHVAERLRSVSVAA